MNRPIVVVDVETNGLTRAHHQVVEVAWWNLDTNHRGVFVPRHNQRMVLHDAELEALRINRYIDRIAERMLDQHATEPAVSCLWAELEGATLAGSNPAFDAGMLADLFERWEMPQPAWHHRLWDLSAYAAGVLGLDELPGLAKVCELLGVTPGDHSAAEDVRAAGECFLRLRGRINHS